MESVKPFAVVAFLEIIPRRDLPRGQVGTVVELLERGVFEVEFSDNEGRTNATLALQANKFMTLHHDMPKVA